MKRLLHLLISRLVHQPGLLRLLAATLQRLPPLEGLAASRMGLATRARSVAEIFLRDSSFSNTSHAPNLVAGPFAIGLESGPRHDAERAELVAMLPPAREFAAGAQACARASMGSLLAAGQAGFDLVEDYMLWVAWAGLRTVFGPAAAALESSAGGARGLLEMMRHPGAHLIIGQVAPRDVQERATLMGSRLRHVVQANVETLRKARPAWRGSDEQVIDRAVGLLWVAHPATVQAAALVMQEWLAQPTVRDDLHRRARALGPGVWDDAPFRHAVKTAAVQALQRRPPFPLLVRDVPRDTSFGIDDTRQASLAAGSPAVVLPVAAMAEAARAGRCPFHPERPPPVADRPFGLVFGMGRRDCIGQDHAIETVTSGLIGLLTLPALTWADPVWRRMGYDGPIIVRMRLRPPDGLSRQARHRSRKGKAMANGQMLCILAPIPPAHARAMRQALAPDGPLRGPLDQALQGAGIFHFASVAVLPGPGVRGGGQEDPRLMIELAVDPHIGVAEATQALARYALPELWSMASPAMPAPVPHAPHLETLAQWLASRATTAGCGFVGTPERTVRQVHAEAALLADARRRAQQTLARDGLSTGAELAASVCTLVDEGCEHDFARQPAPRNFWQRAPFLIRALGAATKLVLPAVLIGVVLLGLLAFFGLGAVAAGGAVLGFEPVVRVALGVQPGAALWAMGVVGAGAMVLWISTALYRQALLSATVVAILLFAAGVLAPSLLLAFPAASQALLALAVWGAAAVSAVALLAALLAAAVGLVVMLAPPFLGWRGLAMWAAALFVPYVAASHLVLQLALHAGTVCFGLEPLQTLRDASPVWGWLPASDLVGAILLAFFLMGLVAVLSGWSFGRTLPDQLLRLLDRPRGLRPLSTALRTHVSIEANEADLRGQTSHMISVTDLRRFGPLGTLPAALTLRIMLWGISVLSTTIFTRGLLGRAAGIHFGHWRLIDGGRRLLFCSNFEGSFGGYLDEFIAGAFQGANLIWRWTELRPRHAAMPDQPGQMPQPGVPQAGQWPPTRFGFLLGCRYEQRFKAYARASQVPHLYRYAAYARSNQDIDRATRLRDALRAKLLAEQAGARALVADDQIMRALES